jgi:hypothetical protein
MLEAMPESNAGEWLLTHALIESVEDIQSQAPSGSGIQFCTDNFPAALASGAEKRSLSTADIEKPPAAPRPGHLSYKSNPAMVTEAGSNPVACPVVFGIVRLELLWGRVGNPDSADGALQHVKLQPSHRIRDSAKARLKSAEAHRASPGSVWRLVHGLIMSNNGITPKDQASRTA